MRLRAFSSQSEHEKIKVNVQVDSNVKYNQYSSTLIVIDLISRLKFTKLRNLATM